MSRRVTSRQNPIVARFRGAAGGTTPQRMLLDGAHLVAEALDARLTLVEAAVTADAEARPEIRRLVSRLERAAVDVVRVTMPVMQALAVVRSPPGLVAIAVRPADGRDRLYAAPAFVLIACDMQDPGNLGAIVRVAEAAGATGVVAAGACADPFGPKALRGSMGSALRLPIAGAEHSRAAVDDARRHGCRILAMAPRGGRTLFDIDLVPPTAVLIGGEGAGLPPSVLDLVDERVTIPMLAPVESLNSAVTAALVAYEGRRQRAADGAAVQHRRPASITSNR